MEGVRRTQEDKALELPFHSSGCPLIPGLSGKQAAHLPSARAAQAWELYTFIQESALPGSEENCTPTCSRSLVEVEWSVFLFSVDVKQMEFISQAIFRVSGTLDIVFA